MEACQSANLGFTLTSVMRTKKHVLIAKEPAVFALQWIQNPVVNVNASISTHSAVELRTFAKSSENNAYNQIANSKSRILLGK